MQEPNEHVSKKKINKRIKDLLLKPAFYEIYQTYNGFNISKDQVKREKVGRLKWFTIDDEKGVPQCWSTAYNNYHVIPTIHGNWTGPNSKNKKKPVDLLDTFAMMHDIDYQNSKRFNRIADYKLISRIHQNLHRMEGMELTMAWITLKYFTTVGGKVRQYMNKTAGLIYTYSHMEVISSSDNE